MIFGAHAQRHTRGAGTSPANGNEWSPLELTPSLWIEPRNGEFSTTNTFDIETVSNRGSASLVLQNTGTITRPDIDWSNPDFLRRVINFSGSSTGLVSSNPVDLSSGYLLWALVHVDVSTSTRYLVRATATTHGFDRNSGGAWRLLFGSNGADSLVISDSGTGVRAILIHYDGAGVASGWLNNWSAAPQTVDRSASGTLTNPNDPIYIGCSNSSGSSPFNGQVASMGIAPMSSSPTQEQRDALGLYLNAQFQSTITTTKTDPATLTGFDGVEQPPEQIVVLGIGQSNRAHNPDTTLTTGAQLPLITGGGGARYLESYPITYHSYVQGTASAEPGHYVIANRNTPNNWRFGREIVWAHRFYNAGPLVEGYIAKAAYGATSIADDWDSSTTPSLTIEDPGYMYHWAVDRITTIANNVRPGARLIIGWTQGETEAALGASTYQSDQDGLFSALVSLASSLGFQTPEVYDSMLHADWESGPVVPSRPYFTDVQNAKTAIAAARSDVTLIPQPLSIDLQSEESDYIHLSAEGQAAMGEAEVAAAGF